MFFERIKLLYTQSSSINSKRISPRTRVASDLYSVDSLAFQRYSRLRMAGQLAKVHECKEIAAAAAAAAVIHQSSVHIAYCCVFESLVCARNQS